jgi:hypothetical protein
MGQSVAYGGTQADSSRSIHPASLTVVCISVSVSKYSVTLLGRVFITTLSRHVCVTTFTYHKFT